MNIYNKNNNKIAHNFTIFIDIILFTSIQLVMYRIIASQRQSDII